MSVRSDYSIAALGLQVLPPLVKLLNGALGFLQSAAGAGKSLVARRRSPLYFGLALRDYFLRGGDGRLNSLQLLLLAVAQLARLDGRDRARGSRGGRSCDPLCLLRRGSFVCR